MVNNNKGSNLWAPAITFSWFVHKSWPKKDKSTNEKYKNKANAPTTVEPLIKN